MRVNKYKVHNSTRVTSSQKDAPLWQRQTDRQTDRDPTFQGIFCTSALGPVLLVTVITLCHRLHEACVSTVREACHNTPARTCSTFNVGRPSPTSYCSPLLLPPSRGEGSATSSFCPHHPPSTLSPRAHLPPVHSTLFLPNPPP